ncbi:MAG TPA: hypothetical protein VFD80_08520 [Flavobacteriaceae bacterium]|nr:hypothetical protein [Flavobacteriaceae bacterium]
MRIPTFILPLIAVFFMQCAKEKDPFLITKNQIGNLHSDIMVQQIDSVLAQDSIVYFTPETSFMAQSEQVEVYEKGGKLLMTLSPSRQGDPNSKISHIQIFDDRYKTDKGLSKNSVFKEVKDNYTISSIQNTFSNIVVSLKDSDVYITLDKKELPEALRYDSSLKIESSQIPDNAKFKYFMIGWNE